MASAPETAAHATAADSERPRRAIIVGACALACVPLAMLLSQPGPPGVSAAKATGAAQPAGESEAAYPAGGRRIDINSADAAELALLPGIGPALAERIIEDRERRGPFKRVEDLDRVKGIGPRIVERVRAMAIVGPSPAPPIAAP